MKLKTNRDSKVEATINLHVDDNYIEKEIDTLVKDQAKHVKVDGFRPGKAPANVVKKMNYDKFRENAIQKIMQDSFVKAMEELKLGQHDILGEPFVDKWEESKKGLEATLKVAIRPEIDLKGYEKHIPEAKIKKPSKKEIDERIMDMARSSATPKPCEDKKKKVENGNHVYLDFEGFVDGKPFDGGKAENYPLEIGSHSFIDTFEDQLVGLKVGDKKDVKVKFPENYGSEALSGKDAVFKIKINQIWTREVGEINDALAKTLLPQEDVKTLKRLQEKVEADLEEEEKMNIYNGELKGKLIDSLTKNMKFEVPEMIVEKEIGYSINEELGKMPREEAEKIANDKKELEKFKKKYRADAEQRVRFTFIVDKIALDNKIGVDDREIHQMIYFEAMQRGQDPQKMLESYEQSGYIMPIKMQMLENKIIKYLFDLKADKKGTKEDKPKAEKPAAKKTTAKKPAEKKEPAKKATTAKKKPAAKKDSK